MPPQPTFACNGRIYRKPNTPTVVVCVDGFDPAYLDVARAEGACPFLARLLEKYGQWTAASVLPSFTNPNNVSLITGVAPLRHGIAGNYVLDPNGGQPVMMKMPDLMRTETILAVGRKIGLSVAAVTAKDKLRRLLGAGMAADDPCLSVEALSNGEDNAVDAAILSALGSDRPDIYSAEISLAVLRVGLALLAHRQPDLIYLSTTDYVQHRHRPDEPEALRFMAALDDLLREIASRGTVMVVTADHGMNAKTKADGTPDVAFFQDVLDVDMPGTGTRVILPITDPYVVHHGALGACAMVYLGDGDAECAIKTLTALPQVEEVIPREAAVKALELPEDRIGDLVVLATASGVLGSSRDARDLSALGAQLRSHGGRHAQPVPFVVNRQPQWTGLPSNLRNYDAFHVALNLLDHRAPHA